MRLNLRNLFLQLITASSISFVMLSPHPTIAQVAEVPNPDSSGDFRSAFQRGNRGFYTISKWLVVQLRVKGSQNELAYPAKPASFEQLGECYVRANLKYIAPINPDSLMAYDTQTYCKEQPLYCQPKHLKWLSLGHTP